jgi:hypothetical protein
MRRVFDGETVYVAVRSETTTTTTASTDRFNNEVASWEQPVTVEHVLVNDATDDDQTHTRPDGITCVYKMAFPYDCNLDLRGAKVTVRGLELHVAGIPTHGPRLEANKYNMIVRAGVHDG